MMLDFPGLDDFLVKDKDVNSKSTEKNGQKNARIKRRKEMIAKASRKRNRGK